MNYEVVSGHHGEALPFRIFNEDDEVEAQFRYRGDAEQWAEILQARNERDES